MSNESYRVLVLGLDGATPDLILPWIEQGHLPCLSKLLEGGAWSPLRSTIPPLTACAWSSFMTGKNPGKHGLFDFIEPLPRGQGFRFTNGASRKGETLWGCLSRQGRRVGVINVPMTYPPEPVNGYLISGLDTPDERSRYTHPEPLREEIHGSEIGYRLDLRHIGNMNNDARRDRVLNELRDIETLRTRTLQHLSKKYPTDFTMLVHMATDHVQHHFWHYMDSSHVKHDAEGAERYRHAIRDIYIHLDQLIASVLEDQDERTIVMVLSDHGFGPITNLRVRMNQALARDGLLTFAREGFAGRALRSVFGVLDRLLRSTLSPGIKRRLASLFPRLRMWFESGDEAAIDWDRTVAFTNEISRCFPTVWLNRAINGSGGVKPEEVEDALQASEQVISKLTDPQTRKPAVRFVYRARDIYHGPYVDQAPDLIPCWWGDGFLLDQSEPGGSAERIVERSRTPVTDGVEFVATHQMDGFFVMAGGPARRGHAFAGAQLIDVAPTVLYLMGLPIPGDMDGKPLLDAIDPEFIARSPVRYENEISPSSNGAPPASDESAFTAEEAEMIAKRLQAMGYIE